jgi:O-antigen ligase
LLKQAFQESRKKIIVKKLTVLPKDLDQTPLSYMPHSNFITDSGKAKFIWPVLLFTAILMGWATANIGFLLPGVLVAMVLLTACTAVVFSNPKVGLIAYITYSFIVEILDRELGGGLPYQNLTFAFISLTLIAAIFNSSKKYEWSNINNDICLLGLVWVGINILQIFNPNAGNILGWLADVKYPFLWILVIPLCMVIFNTKKDLDLFLILILGLSLLAALYGVKQLIIGLTPAEKTFIVESPTHLIWGKLRVFSFYQDAGQFGASMAHFCVIALVLALGPFKLWKRVLCAIASFIFLYGMFISGTRGALFTLITGVFIFLVLTKNFKLVVLGGIIVFAGFFFLKHTHIGHHIYEIRRMRSALNPEDASFNVRLDNQAKLRDYLRDYPFGGGLGSIGYAARAYNEGTYLASIPPDSYWVKVWATYGITGLIIWFGMMMYIIGKCCGIVWNTHDRGLKYKLIALTAGAAGIFISSYGNEVINNQPSSFIVYFSWAFVFLGPQLDSGKSQNIKSYA